MWQMAFLHDHAVKRLDAYFAPAIMAENRQVIRRITLTSLSITHMLWERKVERFAFAEI
jgi:ABC-type uncharacterized transport system ATPase component